MTIRQGLTTSFKQQMLTGAQNLSTDTLKIALYTALASIDETTTEYTTTNEIVGTGYTAGGVTLSNVTISTSQTTAYVTFDNPTWDPASLTARGALIYNNTQSNASIAVIDFGSDKTMSPAFVIQMPANTASTALIRIE
jgi:methanogenic corrinoid protein MtbC1